MEQISNNEMKIMSILFKEPYVDYNANNLSKITNLSSMGTLKILKKLEKQNLIKGKQMGKATFYKPHLKNQYSQIFIELILRKEAEESLPKVKRWIKELKKFEKDSEIGIIFGSLLKKSGFEDIDFLLIINSLKNKKINQITKNLNEINIKKIHLVKQTDKDFKKNIKEKNKIILNALKEGIVIFGHKKIIRAIQDVTQQK